MDNKSIEEYLGFGSGAVEGLGIGGILKVRVEDCRVEEVSPIPALDPKGRFTVVRATLVNWETNRFLKRCLLYTSPSPRDATLSRMPSSA